MISRRVFVVTVGWSFLGLALPRPSFAEKRPWISILHSGFPNRTPIHLLLDALRARGYENARTATVELLGGEGDPERLKTLISHLAAARPDVIIALTSPAVLGLKQAGLMTPVVFGFVPDPIGLGIVSSLGHPGGNFTGISYSEAALGGKRLELLIDALPHTKRVAVLWGPGFVENVALLRNVRRSASARDVEVFSREIRGVEDISAAFADAKRGGAQAVIFMTDNLMFGHRKEIATQALANRLPSIHSFAPEALDGGFMSYGADADETYRRAAALADRILRGARPADLPVEEPTKFTLAVNLRTAKALGLTIPQSLLLRADEVIQ